MAIAGRSYPNVAIISRSSLEDVVVPSVATPGPVTVVGPPDPRFLATPTTTILRNTLQDPPVLTTPAPIVVSTPNANAWYAIPQTIIWNEQPVPQVSTSGPITKPVVVTPPTPSSWFSTPTTIALRNTLQDPLVLTTPEPIVVLPSTSRIWFNTPETTISSAPQQPVAPVSGPTTVPIVVTPTFVKSWFDVHPAIIKTAPLPPALITEPAVVTSSPVTAWFKSNPTTIIRNAPPIIVPAQSTPAPVVISSARGAQFLFKQPTIVRNKLPVTIPGVQTPICYSGTVVDQNLLGGAVVRVDLLGGSVVDSNVLGGTVVDGNVFAGTVAHALVLGGNTVKQTFDGVLVGWCMQEVDISLAEFNDESLTVTITSSGGPFNITGLTMEMYLKVNAGDSDTAPTTIKLSTVTGEITIVDGPNGIANVAIPNTDLQPGDVVGFYRYDVIQATKRHTALYGKVGITQL